MILKRRYLSNVEFSSNRKYEGDNVNILLIVPEYPPFNIGGGGIVFQNIAENLAKKYHNVTVVYGYYPTKRFFEKPLITKLGNITLIRLPLIPTPKSKKYLYSVMPPNIRSIIFLIRIIWKNKFDIIHLHGYGFFLIDIGSLLSSILNKKYIVTLHGIPKTPSKNFVLGFIFKCYSESLGKHTLMHSNIITCVSKSIIKEPIFSKFKHKMHVINNGINLSEYILDNNTDFRKEYNIPNDVDIISSFGRLQWLKGFQYGIKAFYKILKEKPNSIYIIAGNDGGYENSLKELVNNLNLNRNVIFTGFLGMNKKKWLFSNSKVILIPSLEESFGLVGLEAMALGKPIVASNIGGLSEYLDDNKTAIFVEPGNVTNISNAVISLLDNYRMRIELAANAIEKVKNFDWEIITKKYLMIYEITKKI